MHINHETSCAFCKNTYKQKNTHYHGCLFGVWGQGEIDFENSNTAKYERGVFPSPNLILLKVITTNCPSSSSLPYVSKHIFWRDVIALGGGEQPAQGHTGPRARSAGAGRLGHGDRPAQMPKAGQLRRHGGSGAWGEEVGGARAVSWKYFLASVQTWPRKSRGGGRNG